MQFDQFVNFVQVQTPNLDEGESIGGRGWYRSKERW